MLPIEYFFRPQNIFPFWITYILICIPVILIVSLLLPEKKRFPFLPAFLVFYALSASIFIFGIFISLLVILVLRFETQTRKRKTPLTTVAYPDFQSPPVSKIPQYGEGSGFKIVTNKDMPKSSRENMLVAVNQFSNRAINKLNLLLLNDEVDEIRLYAQSLIENQERKISSQIKLFTMKLAAAKSERIEALYKKQIAEALWEQIYKYLLASENLSLALEQIKLFSTEALRQLPEDKQLQLILAKIALLQNNLTEAKKWLEMASIDNAPYHKVLLSFAEIAYREKNYGHIKRLLQHYKAQGWTEMYPVIQFWVNP
jgi:hypothetical protein